MPSVDDLVELLCSAAYLPDTSQMMRILAVQMLNSEGQPEEDIEEMADVVVYASIQPIGNVDRARNELRTRMRVHRLLTLGPDSLHGWTANVYCEETLKALAIDFGQNKEN